jgi:hypothetical protein
MIQVRKRAPKSKYALRLGTDVPFAGMNIKDVDTAIANGFFVYLINMNLDNGGKPGKRRGEKYVLPASKGAGGVKGYYEELFQGKHIYAWGTGLYAFDETAGTESTLMTGLANAQGFFNIFNDVLYYKNGTDYISIDSSLVAKDVIKDLLGYIPTTVINKKPDGTGGTAYESRNLIQPGFTETFIGDGTSADYYLSLINFDATEVKAQKVSGTSWIDLDEDVDFTVTRTTGKVHFNVAPGSATTANVRITPCKTEEGYADRIVKAIRSALYGGGTNDSRIFICGNEDYKNVYHFTGLTGNTNSDALYFPEYNFNRIGSDAKLISNFSYIYSRLIALKEDGIYTINYSLTSGVVTFPAEILNRQVGCDMPDSVQIIRNYPVFGNTQTGLWMVVNVIASDVEKNVEHISNLIDKPPAKVLGITGLLEETDDDLKAATSFDDGKKYYLCIQSHCWVWDYNRVPFAGNNQDFLIWSYYTNINAAAWHYSSKEIYYADRTTGQLVKFQNNLNDFGNAIDGKFKIKNYNLGRIEQKKNIPDIWFSTRNSGGQTINVTYFSDTGEALDPIIVPGSAFTSFRFSTFTFKTFTFRVQKYEQIINRRPNVVDTNYFSMEFRNNEVNEDLSITEIVIFYTYGTYVR